MPTVIPPDYAQAAALFDRAAGGDPAYVVTGHFLGIGPNDPTDVANAVFDAWQGSELGSQFQANTWRMRQVSVRVNRGAGIESGQSTRSPVVGQQGVNSVPPNTAVLVRKGTALGGREGRGRMYLPGLHQDIDNDNGIIVEPYFSQFQTFAAQFNTVCGINNVTHYLLHSAPQLGGAPPPTVVATLIVQPLLATQRRRLR